MKHSIKIVTALTMAAGLGLSSMPAVQAEESAAQPELAARVKNIIEADGLRCV